MKEPEDKVDAITTLRRRMLEPQSIWTKKGMAMLFCKLLQELNGGIMPRAQHCGDIFQESALFGQPKYRNDEEIKDSMDLCIAHVLESHAAFESMCHRAASYFKGNSAKLFHEAFDDSKYGIITRESSDDESDAEYLQRLQNKHDRNSPWWQLFLSILGSFIRPNSESQPVPKGNFPLREGTQLKEILESVTSAQLSAAAKMATLYHKSITQGTTTFNPQIKALEGYLSRRNGADDTSLFIIE